MPKELSREEFIGQLILAGWKEQEAIDEWEWVQSDDGDVDGELDSWW